LVGSFKTPSPSFSVLKNNLYAFSSSWGNQNNRCQNNPQASDRVLSWLSSFTLGPCMTEFCLSSDTTTPGSHPPRLLVFFFFVHTKPPRHHSCFESPPNGWGIPSCLPAIFNPSARRLSAADIVPGTNGGGSVFLRKVPFVFLIVPSPRAVNRQLCG